MFRKTSNSQGSPLTKILQNAPKSMIFNDFQWIWSILKDILEFLPSSQLEKLEKLDYSSFSSCTQSTSIPSHRLQMVTHVPSWINLIKLSEKTGTLLGGLKFPVPNLKLDLELFFKLQSRNIKPLLGGLKFPGLQLETCYQSIYRDASGVD